MEQFNPFKNGSGGGGGGGAQYSVAKYIDDQTGEVTFRLTKDGTDTGETITFNGEGILINDPSAPQGTPEQASIDEVMQMVYDRASATYNFTTFTELNIDTQGKTLLQITNELLAKNLPQNTVVTGQLYTQALPFTGNGEVEVFCNNPAFWWTCKSLNVAPYSWNAITASSSWGQQGMVLDWVPSYNSDVINGLPSGTTEDNIVTWGADGYNVKDSGAALGNNYIELANGQRVYFSSTAPTGTIPDGAIGIGF